MNDDSCKPVWSSYTLTSNRADLRFEILSSASPRPLSPSHNPPHTVSLAYTNHGRRRVLEQRPERRAERRVGQDRKRLHKRTSPRSGRYRPRPPHSSSKRTCHPFLPHRPATAKASQPGKKVRSKRASTTASRPSARPSGATWASSADSAPPSSPSSLGPPCRRPPLPQPH